MTRILDIDEVGEYPCQLEVFVPDQHLEKTALRKMIEKDIKRFLKKGGTIERIETTIVPETVFKVGFNKEGGGKFFSEDN